MRLPSLVVPALLAAATLAGAGSAAAQTTHVSGDRSTAYTLPPGVTVIPSPKSPAGESAFAIARMTGGDTQRAGFCVMRVSALDSQPSEAAWSMLVAHTRNNAEQTARGQVKAPDQFVSLGGFKDVVVGSANGYGYWFDQREKTGQIKTRVTIAVVMMPDRLFSGVCSSSPGAPFTQADIDRIFTLASSARRL